MLYEDLEWCVNLSKMVCSNPRTKTKVWEIVFVVILMVVLIRIPAMTMVMFVYQTEPVTVKEATEVSGNFTLFIHACIYMSTMFLKRSEISDLLQRTENHFWPMEDTEDVKNDLRQAKILNRKVSFNCLVVLISVIIIEPYVVGGECLTFKSYKPVWLPRYVLLLMEGVTTISLLPIFGYFDLMISTLLTLMKIQFRMLNKRMEKICQRKDDEIDAEIKACVDHYCFLIDFVDRFSLIFSKPLFLFIGNIILSLCISMYIILEETSNPKECVEPFIHLLTGLNEICLCYSIPAQGFMNQANIIDMSIYFSDWYERPKYANKLLLTMTRGQKEIKITAGGIVNIDLNMFLMAFKTMVSYCMFLRTISEIN